MRSSRTRFQTAWTASWRVSSRPIRVKSLYGNGHLRLNEEANELERVGGVRWTIKDGIVYDAHQLLQDVRDVVEEQKAERGGS